MVACAWARGCLSLARALPAATQWYSRIECFRHSRWHLLLPAPSLSPHAHGELPRAAGVHSSAQDRQQACATSASTEAPLIIPRRHTWDRCIHQCCLAICLGQEHCQQPLTHQVFCCIHVGAPFHQHLHHPFVSMSCCLVQRGMVQLHVTQEIASPCFSYDKCIIERGAILYSSVPQHTEWGVPRDPPPAEAQYYSQRTQ